jgi:hypothetical protein
VTNTPVGSKSDVAPEKIAPIPESIKNPKKEPAAKPSGNTKYKVETYEMVNNMLDKEPVLSIETVMAHIRRRGFGDNKAEEFLNDMQTTEEISIKTFAGKTYVVKFGQPDNCIEKMIRNAIPGLT